MSSDDRFITKIMETKRRVHIMVFGVVTSEENIMSPSIFPHGLRLNTENYITYLKEVVLIWSLGWMLRNLRLAKGFYTMAHKLVKLVERKYL